MRSMATTSSGNGEVGAGALALDARRIIPSLDFVGDGARTIDHAALVHVLRLSTNHFYTGLLGLKTHLDGVVGQLPTKLLPASLIGTVQQPDGHPGSGLLVEADLPGGALGDAAPHAITADDGSFSIKLVAPAGLATNQTLTLLVRGADGSQAFSLGPDRVSSTGLVGTLTLDSRLAPLPVSIIASLAALLAGAAAAQQGQPAPVSTPPVVALGDAEDDVCTRQFGSDASVSRFPYSVLFRLVEPRTSVLNRAFIFTFEGGQFQIAARNGQWQGQEEGGVTTAFVDRVPIDQPLSIDGFRDQLAGIGETGRVGADETVPMAGTLGLGYLVNMAQLWTPHGVGLGDLVYSLPLAPGEQQLVAIFERREETAVIESETLSVAEQQAFQQQQDTSAQATFDQAFSESARGGSQFSTEAFSASTGFNVLVASGSAGVAASGGQSTSWMDGQRDVASRAVESTHAAVHRSASARRSAQRTSMRLASASESQDVTTKVITNHNHTRALTLQYWEVQRLYDVTTAVDGVTIVCFVPLELIRFLPAGQVARLDENSVPTLRSQVLERYAQVLKHADILARVLPRQYLQGLALISEFAADPHAGVDTAPGNAEDVIDVSLHAGILPFEQIFVSAVTRRGTRVGPLPLTGKVDQVRGQPDAKGAMESTAAFTNADELFGYLRQRRTNDDVLLEGKLALPGSLARTDVVGFEISRAWKTLDVTFISPELQAAAALKALGPLGAGITLGPVEVAAAKTTSAHYSPQQLEQQLAGPLVWDLEARIEGSTEQYAIGSLSPVILPTTAMPVPALEVAPVLRFSALLQIEKMLQHVVRNMVSYSRAVWASLTAEERVILLEGFTIGVSLGGVQDTTQDVPLLNCVANQVVGFYGNSMILPFIIPAQVAEAQGFSSKQLEDALAGFHRAGFDPPQSRIALPTRGVLGEAVLGRCPSAERIDLTRFWNWTDAPADTAPAIAAVTLPTTAASVAAGLTAPNTLTGMAPLITNFNNQPPIPVDTSLMQALISAGAGQKDFTGLTNADLLAGLIKTSQTTAEQARADALKRATELQSQAMTEIGNYFGATGGESYASNFRDGSSGGGGAPAGGTSSGTAAGGKSGGGTASTGGKSGGGGTTGGGTTGGGTTGGGTTGGGTTGGGTTGGGTTGGGTTGGGTTGGGTTGGGTTGGGTTGGS
jgi:hypothetical protein